MKRQTGMSLIGLLLTGVLLGGVFLLGMKTVPAFTEYTAIKRAINSIASNGGGNASISELRKDFDRHAAVDDITSVRGADLGIAKRAGAVQISIAYERKVPVVANVSLVFDFEASSTGH